MPGVDVKLVLRSTRVVTPEGTRAAAVSVAGGRDRGGPAARRRGARRRPRRGLRRRRPAARPRRHPCPCERPRPHRVGGLLDRHPRRRRRRHHHPARHAAQLPPADHHGRAPARQAARSPRPRRTSTPASGAARSRPTSKDLRPLYEAGVFGFKCFLSPSGVEEFPELDQEQLAALHGGDRRLRRPADRARRGPAPPGRGPAAERPRSTPTSSPPARATPRTPPSRA